jgi:isoquinoline 1-oxidoreductase beta subunit
MNRREFLNISTLAGGGFFLGLYTPLEAAEIISASTNTLLQQSTAANTLNAYVSIAPNGAITIMAKLLDIGQGTKTSLPMIIAEELCAKWDDVRVELAPLDRTKFGGQGVGGSTSIVEDYSTMRRVGAAAREALIRAAAAKWSVEPSTCVAINSTVTHPPTKRTATFGELAEAASKLTLPKELLEKPPLKDPKTFTIIGSSCRAVDLERLVTGQTQYGLDVRLEGLLYAVIQKPPRFGATILSIDDTKARAVEGVKHIVKLEPFSNPTQGLTGVAVVATSTWAAIKGRAALETQWSDGANPQESSATLHKQFTETLAKPCTMLREQGDVDEAITTAAKRIEAVYDVPFLAHAAMEPVNYTAHVVEKKCTLWGPTQSPGSCRILVSQALSIPVENVTVNIPDRVGGGFGRRLMADYAVEAAMIAKAVPAPVKVVWTREDDFAHDFYRPAGMYSLRGGVDEKGKVIAWHSRITTVSRSVFAKAQGVPPHQTEAFPEGFPASFVPNFRMEYRAANSNVPTGFLRAPGHNATAFADQCFTDELAHAAGRDPLAVRLELLGRAREIPYSAHGGNYNTGKLKAVLERVAEISGWKQANHGAPKGRARGIAGHFTFGSYVAEVVEVSVEGGKIKVHKVFAVVDCGQVVNKSGAEAQISGAIIDALSAALYGEITIENAAAKQRNFDTFPMLRIGETPEIEVHFVESHEAPQGLGEMGYPVLAPAVCNAIFAATGKRIRSLPIRLV